MKSDNPLIRAREEYCADHSTHPLKKILKEIEHHTEATHEKPQMLSGYLQGSFLSMLSCLMQPKRILEIGTYTGYSAVCLAQGLPSEGELISLEKDQKLKSTIYQNLEAAGLNHHVKVLYGDAKETLLSLSGPFDLVFVDAAKKAYPYYVEHSLKLLRPGGLMVIDNTLFHDEVLKKIPDGNIAQSMKAFNDWLMDIDNIEMVMLPIRDGLTLLRKKE